MKPATLIFLILAIIVLFLSHGAFLIQDIQEINHSMLSNKHISPHDLQDFSQHLNDFQNFIYLFGALIASIALSLMPILKHSLTKEQEKKRLIRRLTQLKNKEKLEKQSI